MNLKIRLIDFHAERTIRPMVAVYILLGFLIHVASAQAKNQVEPGELYGGIELGIDGARAIALRVFSNAEELAPKLVYSEAIRLALRPSSTGELDSQAIRQATVAVHKLLKRLRQEHHVPNERIYLIGSSQIGAHSLEALAAAITEATGKTLIFLDTVTEVELNIVGTIPHRSKSGDAWVDNRSTSVLLEIGSNATTGGYQMLKYSPSGRVGYEFVTMNLPYGMINFTNEVSQAVGAGGSLLAYIQRAQIMGPASYKNSLQNASNAKPGMLTRKRVYLSGDIVRALVTLLYPEEKGNFVPLTANDIKAFAKKASYDPLQLLNPKLSQIRSRELRQEIELELESVRNSYTPQQIVAGAELLKTMAAEFSLQEKSLWFARYGHLSRILSYVRLQATK